MAENSKIGWTTHTMNFWMGCNKVSTECLFCYIYLILKRMGLEPFNGPIRTKDWSKPDRWNRAAEGKPERPRIFTCSLSDFFHPRADAWRAEAWQIIERTTNLDWLILTKRPELVRDRLPGNWGAGYPNVWLGVTCGSRSSLPRLDLLRGIAAKVKFVSAEPLLEAIDFRPYLPWLDWVITGCEQAAKGKRRLMNIEWVRDIERQCDEFGVAHFFKQAYENDRGRPVTSPLLDGSVVQEFPHSRLGQDEIRGLHPLPLLSTT